MEKCPSKDISAIMDFCHGKHYHAYQFLGAHPKKKDKGKGFFFRVYDDLNLCFIISRKGIFSYHVQFL